MLNEMSKSIYEANKEKGFDVKNENLGQTLMLVVSELSEALEAVRTDKRSDNRGLKFLQEKPFSEWIEDSTNNKEHFQANFKLAIKDTFEDEIADAFIRLFDLCGAFEIDIEKHIELKRRYNAMREFKHGKDF